MGVKLLVCYPSGAGGWWLSNLIHKLERNQFGNESDNVVNFHKHTKSRNVQVSHYPITPLPDNLQYQHVINFSGLCYFNFYLNVIEKLYLDSNMLGESFHNDCHLLSCEALNKFNFPKKTDLDYQLIFKNPDQFIECLFTLLDQADFKYTKNQDICLQSIQQFKLTCPDPMQYFDNFDNLIWLGWCIGLLKYMQQPVPAYDSQLRDHLLQQRSLFLEISKDVTMKFNGD